MDELAEWLPVHFGARPAHPAQEFVVGLLQAQTGVEVKVLKAGDTGTMVSKAVLTSGKPEGDVMFGVDNTFLSKAVDAKVRADEPSWWLAEAGSR